MQLHAAVLQDKPDYRYPLIFMRYNGPGLIAPRTVKIFLPEACPTFSVGDMGFQNRQKPGTPSMSKVRKPHLSTIKHLFPGPALIQKGRPLSQQLGIL